MKDAYSFDADLEQLNQSYDKMYAAYCRIFDRCGLHYLVVEAESGPIGGDASHEFMVPCANGEDMVLHCAQLRLRGQPGEGRDRRPRASAAREPAVDAPPYQAVATPGKRTIGEVCEFLGVEEIESEDADLPGRRQADRRPACAATTSQRGQDPPAAGASVLVPADAAMIEKVTGAPWVSSAGRRSRSRW